MPSLWLLQYNSIKMATRETVDMVTMRTIFVTLAATAAISLVAACAVNPVTGRSELSLVSEQEEKQIGVEQYGPSQQSQGGSYQVDPELTAYVNQVGQRVAAVADRKLDYEFVVLNNGVPNAWALPGGKIAVNRGLLYELHSEAELAAVLGHEVSHAAIGHGAQSMSRGTLLQGALAVGAVAVGMSDYRDYGDFIVGGAQLGAQLISQSYGRDAEREADHYGIIYMSRVGYDPRAAISLQETFVRLSEGKDAGWLEGLFASHPPSRERVQNNREQVNALLPSLGTRDLDVGEQRYQQAIAKLNKEKPAYKQFDDAEMAVAKKDYTRAMTLVDNAIKQVPNEARFHGLKGDIQVYQKNYQQALNSYNEAIRRDANYFDYYLGRGVAHARLNQNKEAREDLQQSTKLLPTAMAMNELGKIALNDGNRTDAKRYFQQASQAQGLVGQEASAAFARLDVQDNPGRYLQVQSYIDRNGRIFARIGNRSPVDMRNIDIQFRALINGKVVQRRAALRMLSAQGTEDVYSGLAFPEGSQWSSEMVEAQVVGAGL